MIESCDSNILFAALYASAPGHDRARAYLDSQKHSEHYRICELVLMEVYCLLRNPKVVEKPLSPAMAVAATRSLRTHPYWLVIDYPGGLMNPVWEIAAGDQFARTSIFDARLALTLRHFGVTRFATRNIKHFASYGFDEVFDPTK